MVQDEKLAIQISDRGTYSRQGATKRRKISTQIGRRVFMILAIKVTIAVC